MTAAEEQNAKTKESFCSAMQGSFFRRHTKEKFSRILAQLLVIFTGNKTPEQSILDVQCLKVFGVY